MSFRSRDFWRFVACGPVCLVVFLGSGCSKPPPPKEAESRKNLQSIREAYTKAIADLNRPPGNRQELVPYLRPLGDPENLLRSPDDGKDYVIIYGANPNASQAEVIAYERDGKDGRRYVLRGHVVWSLSEEDLRKIPFPPGHGPF